MIIASIVNKKIFSGTEYFLAFCVSLGLVLFAAADWSVSPSFNPIGLTFVSLSVCADAILPNAQERLFRMGSSRLEVTYFTNIYTLIAMTISTLISGDFIGLLLFARTSNILCVYIIIYTFIAYIAVSIHMNVVKRFGGVAAVLVATGRKGMTLVLSFVLFPKAFSWFYVFGAILVLGSILASSLLKMRNKKNQKIVKRKQSNDDIDLIMSNGKDMESLAPSGGIDDPVPKVEMIGIQDSHNDADGHAGTLHERRHDHKQ